jgi:nitrous oxidase accessory protein NosD
VSNNSDIIQVWYGTYNEHIVINKSLTVESKDGTGDTFMDGMGSGVVVDITSDNVTFEGFTVQNGEIGIKLTGNNSVVIDNSIRNIPGASGGGYCYGVYLYSVINNSIYRNSISDVMGAAGSSSSATGRAGTGGYTYGIYFNSGTNNRISGNTISNIAGGTGGANSYSASPWYHGYGGYGGYSYGIYLNPGTNNHISSNTISSVTGGAGGSATGYYGSVYTGYGGDGGSSRGIVIVSSDSNTIFNNTVSGVHKGAGGYGTCTYGSPGTGYGIAVISATNRNIIYNNNFENADTQDGYDSGGNNAWDSGPTFGGNYWSDYPGNDTGGDGIGDTPYDLGGGIGAKDYYPFMNKNGWVTDTEPPASITNLTNATYEQTYINWTWTNPNDVDFNHIMVFIDGAWQTNTTSEYYNATGFTPGTSHEIATHTVDLSGNVNTSWVSHTATASPAISVRGDLNGDGILPPADAAIALQIAASGAHDDGDRIIVITLTDGGIGDDDLTENGVIVDDGGPSLPKKGDLNRDGILTSADAAIALEIAAGSRPRNAAMLAAADVSGDGCVTSLDALMILQAVDEKIEL